ncbi:MAG: nuclear transport factor 2 family protein [Thaumarchaeota archaeon]|nr:nuclear transport factor 2 family protein [Nitrososphaerota archaeon]
MTSSLNSANDVDQITQLITTLFEAGKRRDFALIAGLHSDDDRFSKFDDSPPYRKQNYGEALMHEEAAFAGISDYHYAIQDLKIEVFGETALATFYLKYGGVVVDSYSFRGQSVEVESRVSMVLRKKPQGWVIFHEHFSRIPSVGKD